MLNQLTRSNFPPNIGPVRSWHMSFDILICFCQNHISTDATVADLSRPRPVGGRTSHHSGRRPYCGCELKRIKRPNQSRWGFL